MGAVGEDGDDLVGSALEAAGIGLWGSEVGSQEDSSVISLFAVLPSIVTFKRVLSLAA
jgi:hypothetical protein